MRNFACKHDSEELHVVGVTEKAIFIFVNSRTLASGAFLFLRGTRVGYLGMI